MQYPVQVSLLLWQMYLVLQFRFFVFSSNTRQGYGVGEYLLAQVTFTVHIIV